MWALAKEEMHNVTSWAPIKVSPLGGARQTARTLPSLMSRFNGIGMHIGKDSNDVRQKWVF